MAGQHQARRRFGQNFLQDDRVIQQIIAVTGVLPNDTVVEIGPGQGALTRELIPLCQRLIVIELDRDLAATLRTELGNQLQLIEDDALRVDLSDLADQGYRLLGNLPYNISTPLLFHFFAHLSAWRDAHVMLQKEVAQRITAPVGSSNYSRLTVMTQFYVNAELLLEVPPESFYPAPKVTSAVVRLTPRQLLLEQPLQQQEFAALVKTAFAQRRKTLANNLRGVLTRAAIEQAGIDPGRRPQTLSVEDFVSLLNVKHAGCSE